MDQDANETGHGREGEWWAAPDESVAAARTSGDKASGTPKASRLREEAINIAGMYAFMMGAGAAITIGVNGIIHFVGWTPYEAFPWLALRIGLMAGFVVATVVAIIAAPSSD